MISVMHISYLHRSRNTLARQGGLEDDQPLIASRPGVPLMQVGRLGDWPIAEPRHPTLGDLQHRLRVGHADIDELLGCHTPNLHPVFCAPGASCQAQESRQYFSKALCNSCWKIKSVARKSLLRVVCTKDACPCFRPDRSEPGEYSATDVNVGVPREGL